MASEKDKSAGPQGTSNKPTGASGSGSEAGKTTASGAGTGSSKSGSGFTSGQKKPTKPAVTIDLKAEEVKSSADKTAKPADDKQKKAPASSMAGKTEQPKSVAKDANKDQKSSSLADKKDKQSDQKPASAAGSVSRAAGAQTSAKAGTGSSASSKASTPPSSKGAPSATASKPSTGGFQSRPPSAPAPKSSIGFFGVLSAAVIGGVAVLAGGYGLVESGYVKLGDQNLSSRIATIEASGRDEIEALKGAVSDQVSSATGALESELESLKSRFADIDGRVTEIASAPVAESTDGAALKQTVDGLTEQVKALRDAVSSGDAGGSAAAASLNETLKSVQNQFETFQKSTAADLDAVKKQMSDLGSATAQTRAVQQTVAGLANQLKTAEASGKTTEELVTAQADTLQTMQSQFVGLSGQLSTTQEQLAGIAKNAEALAKQISELQGQLTALSTRTETVEEAVGTVSARELASRAIAISALKEAVDDGRPYGTELAAVSKMLPEGTDLSLLTQNAEEGIETTAQLIADFPNVARSMGAALNRAEAGDDVLDQLLTNARSLVTIRRSGEESSTDPSSVIGSMAKKVATADLAGALTSYDALPEAARQAGAAWANAAKTRLEADSLVSKVTKDVIETLAASSH